MRKLIFFCLMFVVSVSVIAQDKSNTVTAPSGARIVQLEDEIRLLKYKLDEYQSISDKKIWVLTEENKSLKDQINSCANNYADSVSNAIDKGIICNVQQQLDWSIGFMNIIFVLIAILVSCLLGFNLYKYPQWKEIIEEAKKDCEFLCEARKNIESSKDNANVFTGNSLSKIPTAEELKEFKNKMEDFQLKLVLSELLGNQFKAEDYFALGCDKYYSGLYSDALEYFGKAIAINPNVAVAWFNKGVTLGELKRYDDAIIAYDKAIAINPNYVEAWGNKGNILRKLNRYDDAIIAYDKAISINPNHPEAWGNKGVSLSDLKKHDEAIIAFDKAIAIKPNFAEAYYNKGIVLNELKRYEDAIKACDKAIAIKPNYVEAWCNKGVALHMLKRYNDAISAYDEVIAINPNDAIAWWNKACAYSLKKDRKNALNNLKRAVELDPDNIEKAKKDEDFKWLWDDPDFRAIVG